MSRPLITLITDFGLADSYVGMMKGVILGICPDATLVDISHEIRPQSIRQAAYVLSTAVPYFPLHTVHLVVVDPGVGSARRPIIVQTQQATYVAPDNGVLEMALTHHPASQVIHLNNPKYHLPQASTTFHGRDIFAPAAAHLARGVVPAEMGHNMPVTDLATLPSNQLSAQTEGLWVGEVIHVDHFGNLITSFSASMLEPNISVHVGNERIEGLAHTFSDVEKGELLAYIGSSGRLEIALREGHAAHQLSMDISDVVKITRGRNH
jgi:S-adenosylmethionine hydrolase